MSQFFSCGAVECTTSNY